jgi:hypothetical protein
LSSQLHLDALHWMMRLDEGLNELADGYLAFKANLRDTLFTPDGPTLQRICELLRYKRENMGLNDSQLRSNAIAWGLENGTLPRTIADAGTVTAKCVSRTLPCAVQHDA